VRPFLFVAGHQDEAQIKRGGGRLWLSGLGLMVHVLRLRHLNMDKPSEISSKTLKGLPPSLIAMMNLRLGTEVMESITVLADYAHRHQICLNCPNKCCLLVRCELYYSGFSQCPIFPYRPAICRMHFCERFEVGDISFIGEFADIYLNSLFEAKLKGSTRVDLFDGPPLRKYASELLAAVSLWVNEFKEGFLDQIGAVKLIQNEAAKFRSSPATLVPQKTSRSLEGLFEEDKRLFHDI
jgi:hypothetical protein